MEVLINLPTLPALVDGTVVHDRLLPRPYALKHDHRLWLVDLDAMPAYAPPLKWLAAIRAQDHLAAYADEPDSLRDRVLRCLAAKSELDASTIDKFVMLTSPRSLGYVFDPLTVFWCLDSDANLVVALAEVHNTYGEQHVYVLTPDERGRSSTAKEFYVSPFFEVNGEYQITLVLKRDRVSTTIALRQVGELSFVGTFDGTPRPLTRATAVISALRRPWSTYRVSALIRFHGIRLWLRKHPVITRPAPPDPQQPDQTEQ